MKAINKKGKLIIFLSSISIFLLFIAHNTPAQEYLAKANENNEILLNKDEFLFEKEVKNYNGNNNPEEKREFHKLIDPFTKEYNLNDTIKENMAWDKNISFQKSNSQNLRLSVGIINLNQIMGGAMFKVKLFN